MEDWTTTLVWAFTPGRQTWRLVSPTGDVRYLKLAPLGEESGLAAERERLEWAAPLLPVPRVVASGSDGESDWLVTSGLAGRNAIEDDLRAEPSRLVPLLGEGLRQIHALPVSDCPFDNRLARVFPLAQQRIEQGVVDPGRDLHRDHQLFSVDAALARLQQLRPSREDLVVCHGDYCLPNVLIDNWQVCGFVDFGNLGVADRWADLAVATWSVTWNLGPGWEDAFFRAYGVERDSRKIAFYRLLYDLLP
jgi:kanamycin kinase